MKLHTINTGLFKLDGGAMFGVVPKQLWQRLNPPDETNKCTWAMRCLLIEVDDRKILVDTGIGNKQDEKFRSHFQPHGEDSLLHSLQQVGYTAADITDVFLTHLHFDHSGAAISRQEDGKLVPTFPNATYWSNKQHYDWALHPNPREKASFLKENFVPLQEDGVLKFLEPGIPDQWNNWISGIDYQLVYGHTEAMMLLKIPFKGTHLIYCADLIPSSYHIGLPYVMSYDIRPLKTMEEKTRLLQEAIDQNYLLYFEHDPEVECGYVKKNERGRIVLGQGLQLSELT